MVACSVLEVLEILQAFCLNHLLKVVEFTTTQMIFTDFQYLLHQTSKFSYQFYIISISTYFLVQDVWVCFVFGLVQVFFKKTNIENKQKYNPWHIL